LIDEKTRAAMQRRLRFSLLILVSQILLVALAISWLVHMGIIAVSGSVYFVENNPWILWTEISVSVLITLFAIMILIMQIQRLGERRQGDRRQGDRRSVDRPGERQFR
jgi:membrane protein implicated in regulation of membrane protease activity